MEQKIIPAIIPVSLEYLRESLSSIQSFSKAVQIDIVDGIFVREKSWPYTDNASPEALSEFSDDFDIEVDLMIDSPEKHIEGYLKAGVKRVVVHLESVTDMDVLVAYKNKYDFLLGFSISNDTDVHVLTDMIMYADYVQLMGISKIGSQGQKFDERVLSRIHMILESFPMLEISIDGSVNGETLSLLQEACASRFVVGSAIMSAPSPEDAYNALLESTRI